MSREACHFTARILVEARDPLLIPSILGRLMESLAGSCEETISGGSWSMHACKDTLAKTSALFPDAPGPVGRTPLLVVVIESRDPRELARLSATVTKTLDEDFPGQAHARLEP